MRKEVQKHPFSTMNLCYDEKTHGLRVWDVIVKTDDADLKAEGCPVGRIRILAIVPRSPNKLENIIYSIAFCSPKDFNKYNKRIASKICVGRLFTFWSKLAGTKNVWNNDSAVFGCGLLEQTDTLKNFAEQALRNLDNKDVGLVPQWIPLDVTGSIVEKHNVYQKQK